jgi:hypothetical protein
MEQTSIVVGANPTPVTRKCPNMKKQKFIHILKFVLEGKSLVLDITTTDEKPNGVITNEPINPKRYKATIKLEEVKESVR